MAEGFMSQKHGHQPIQPPRTRKVLTVTFDVSHLTRDETAYLVAEVIAQGERSEGHPDAPLLGTTEGIEWRPRP